MTLALPKRRIFDQVKGWRRMCLCTRAYRYNINIVVGTELRIQLCMFTSLCTLFYSSLQLQFIYLLDNFLFMIKLRTTKINKIFLFVFFRQHPNGSSLSVPSPSSLFLVVFYNLLFMPVQNELGSFNTPPFLYIPSRPLLDFPFTCDYPFLLSS